jgi:hypothetical protein
MEELAYHVFDGAAGIGPALPDRFLQQVDVGGGQQNQAAFSQQQTDGSPPLQQPYYQNQIQDGQAKPERYKYYTDSDESFYNEVLSTLHGFGDPKKEINGATDVGVSDAMASFGFNSFLFLILIFTYEFASRMMPSVYASRKLHVTDDKKVTDIPKSCLPFSWLPAVFGTSWMNVRKCGGLDAYFFLRFIRMCFRITFISGIWGMIVLWPVFATGQGGATGWYVVKNIGIVSFNP